MFLPYTAGTVCARDCTFQKNWKFIEAQDVLIWEGRRQENALQIGLFATF